MQLLASMLARHNQIIQTSCIQQDNGPPSVLQLGTELTIELAIIRVYFFTQPTWLNASRLVPHMATWAKLTEGAPCELWVKGIPVGHRWWTVYIAKFRHHLGLLPRCAELTR